MTFNADETPGQRASRLAQAAILRHGIAKRLRQIQALRVQTEILWERRHEQHGDKRVLVREVGCPMLWHPGYGCFAPVDDEDSPYEGFSVQREDLDGVDADGVRCSIQRLVRVPKFRRQSSPLRQGEPVQAPVETDIAAVGTTGQCCVSEPACSCPTGPALPGGLDHKPVPAEQAASMGAGSSQDRELVRCVVLVRDRERLPRIPSRGILGRASTAHGYADHLTAIRRERIAERNRKRMDWSAPVCEAIVGLGGRIERRLTGVLSAVVAQVPRGSLPALRAHPDVEQVDFRESPEVPDSALSTAYLCGGSPNYLSGYPLDDNDCVEAADGCVTGVTSTWRTDCPTGDVPLDPSTPVLMLGGKVAAANAHTYLDAGYTGAGGNGVGKSAEGGLAEWALGWDVAQEERTTDTGTLAEVTAEVPHLVLAVLDSKGVYLGHPAFTGVDGQTRFRYYLDSNSDFRLGSLWAPDQPLPSDPHGTNCAGVALANVTDGQDDRVSGESFQHTRSGFARRALAVGVNTTGLNIAEFLELNNGSISPEYAGYDLEDGLGVDVVTHSGSANSGTTTTPVNRKYNCPTNEEARGLDDKSQAITRAFCEDSVVVLKSAGNMHSTTGSNVRAVCTAGSAVPFQVSCPGAAPAALPVGAASIFQAGSYSDDWPAAVQSSYDLTRQSARGRTADGRTYPLLLAQGWSCGVPSARDSYGTRYNAFGATSAAAPAAAGAMVLFKHWYLDAHGPGVANQPGRLISNLLNFASGPVYQGSSPAARTTDPPAQGWGMGLLRMRLFDSSGMTSPWLRGTASAQIATDQDLAVIPIGSGDGSRIPSGTSRLRITAWWLEVNTKASESKADIVLSLFQEGHAGTRRVATAQSDGETAMRLEWECYGYGGIRPPTGAVYLTVSSDGDVPSDARYPYRDHRTVYVSWFWEAGPDVSLIECGTAQTELCGPTETAVIDEFDPSLVGLAGGREAEEEHLLFTLENYLAAGNRFVKKAVDWVPPVLP